jgi:hypothetical protein
MNNSDHRTVWRGNLVPGTALTRRQFLVSAAISLGVTRAFASGECRQDPMTGSLFCVAGIRSAVLDHNLAAAGVATSQQQSQWCWAACISMVFAYHGYDVSQLDIVARIKGAPVNEPGRGEEVSNALNASWHDRRGRRFRSRARVWDVMNGRNELSGNQAVIQDLLEDHPLISGAAGHATVVTAMEYYATPAGPLPVRVHVRDPWPGRGRRVLMPEEMAPLYVAGVRVIPA